jgi:pyruvate formate lyase activating enzyme
MEGLVDHLAMDIKGPLRDDAYRRLAGVPVDTEAIRRSVGLIIGSGLPHTFRTTVVPGLLDEQDLIDLAAELHGGSGLLLQNFKPEDALDDSLRTLRPHPPEEITRLSRIVNGVS